MAVAGFPPLPEASARLAEVRLAHEGGSRPTGPPEGGHYRFIMQRVLALIIVLSVAPSIGRAQPPPPPPPPRDLSASQPGTGVIRGRVLAAETGDPLRNARVGLASEMGVQPVLTDGDGRFALTRIPAGSHVVTASKTGYTRTAFGTRGSGRPVRIALAAGGVVDGVDIRLAKSGAISGHVLDDLGEPLPLTTIVAEQLVRVDGYRSTCRVASVETDDLGDYRLFDLPAGRFVVSVARVGTEDAGRGPIDVEGDTSWTHSYYPGVAGVAQAQPIAVRPGDDVPGIDFTAVPTRRPTLSVTVLDSNGSPAEANVTFGSESPLAASFIVSAWTARGSAVSALDQGTWTVLATGAKGVGVAHVTLGPDDASLQITLTRGGRLSGRVVTDGRPLPPGAAVTLEAFPLDPPLGRASAFAQPGRVNADGTFELAGLIGAREVRLRNAPRGWIVKDVLAAGRSLFDAPPEFASGVEITDVEVVLTDHHSELSGHLAAGTAPSRGSDYSVLVFADDRALLRNARRWARWVRPNFDGGFVADDLLPGTYLAVAVPADAVDEAEWQNADYLDRFRSGATRVTLGDREKRTVVLELTGAR